MHIYHYQSPPFSRMWQMCRYTQQEPLLILHSDDAVRSCEVPRHQNWSVIVTLLCFKPSIEPTLGHQDDGANIRYNFEWSKLIFHSLYHNLKPPSGMVRSAGLSPLPGAKLVEKVEFSSIHFIHLTPWMNHHLNKIFYLCEKNECRSFLNLLIATIQMWLRK